MSGYYPPPQQQPCPPQGYAPQPGYYPPPPMQQQQPMSGYAPPPTSNAPPPFAPQQQSVPPHFAPQQQSGPPHFAPQQQSGPPHFAPQQQSVPPHFAPQQQSGPPPPASVCMSQVELTINCRNLMDKDVLSKSDPMVSVSIMLNGKWLEKGRTENIRNSLNPDFSRKIKLDYYFEETQNVRFDVYDIDNTTPSLSDDDFLGQAQCTLGQIVSSACLIKPLLYNNGTKMGNSTISIYAEEVDLNSREILRVQFKGESLDNKEFFSKSDPFLEISKPGIDGKWQLVHRTETIKNNLNPIWKTFELQQRHLGGNNIETQLLLTCFDWESNGGHRLIGQCNLTLAELLEAQQQPKRWPCINTKKQAKKGAKYKDSGRIVLTNCVLSKCHSFLDYVLGGTQINFTVAIDFTASNGDPRQPNSLHYMHPQRPNEYCNAIYGVGTVVQDYDSDKMFPALGFGAKIPPHFQVSHEFALNFNIANPFCSGVDGLVQAYRNCLSQVQLYGPTNFAPVINHVAQFAQQSHQQQNYFILLILTDGVVTDMPDTCRAIVRASNLPLSIIIVGVGQADFSNMDFLDGDGQLLRAPDGTTAVRDIVQFVPFYKYKNVDPAFLAKEVLAEVPQQLTDYFRLRNIPPNPPRQNASSIPPSI